MPFTPGKPSSRDDRHSPRPTPNADRPRRGLVVPLLILVVCLATFGADVRSTAAATDVDGDGYSDAIEEAVGTDPLSACSYTQVADDEETDSWPPDFNDDTQITIQDLVLLRGVYGTASGDTGYHPRFDLNADGQISISDVVPIRDIYDTACTPEPAPEDALGVGSRVPWAGENWYLHGANVPWYNWGCDFGCGANGGASSDNVQQQLRSGFQQLSDAGIHVARWWTFPGDPWQITKDSEGKPAGINPAVYTDFDAALALAEEYDLYFVFTLFSSPTRLPESWMANPDERAMLTDALGELFAHYADNPRILTWQVFNEPEWHIWNGDVQKQLVQAAVKDIAAAVHANSSAYVSLGSAHIGGLPMWVGLGLDYYTAHWYDGMTNNQSCALCTDYQELVQRHGLDGPLVIGEFFAGSSIDAQQRFENWYDKGFAGAFAWSLFSNRTNDGMSIDFNAAAAFAEDHSDIGPRSDPLTAPNVEQWGMFETSVTNTTNYGDPYRDVTLNATFTRPGGGTVDFWGFYDGGDTWRLRFMCDELGNWSYTASFSDGSPGTSGNFDCIQSDLPGMISADETNPMWFGFEGGNHTLVRSFHVGDRFFATNWDDPANANDGNKRAQFLDWAQQQGYNTLSIASHYLNRNVSGRGAGWETPHLWDGTTDRPDAAEYRELEVILDDLEDRRLRIFPFAGFFGESADDPDTNADKTLYIKYTLARLGAYWNVMLSVGGPETVDYMSVEEEKRLGNEIASLDPFGHLLSAHDNHTGQAPHHVNDAWASYVTFQGAKTTNLSSLSGALLSTNNRNFGKPFYAQETLWPGNSGHPDFSLAEIRKNAYVINVSAAALNFADMNGNSSSGFSGNMDLSQRHQEWHDEVKKVWDFFETVPFYRMSPRQDLVSSGYALAEPGARYLVYLPSGGSVDVSVSGGTYSVEWINGQDPSDRRSGGTTSNGEGLTSPSDGDDWLVYLTSGTSADPTPTPSASATPTPTPTLSAGTVVMEAEEMSLSGYAEDPANGDWIMVTASESGTAIDSFPGASDTYAITIHAVAEDDGQSTLELWIEGTLKATFTYPLAGSGSRDPITLTGPTLSINNGAEIKLVGFKDNTTDGTSHARVDDVTFNPAQ